jgi:hypothetical protein
MSCTMTPLAQRLTHQGSNFAPLPDALVAQGEPAQQHDLTEIPQCQPVALPENTTNAMMSLGSDARLSTPSRRRAHADRPTRSIRQSAHAIRLISGAAPEPTFQIAR